jgi:ubiquitin carboxyl-terminal hydrolase 36/42
VKLGGRGGWADGAGCSQEDAHDFFYQMLDAMHTIALKEAGGEKRHDPTTQQTSLVYHMFGGYTRSQVKP